MHYALASDAAFSAAGASAGAGLGARRASFLNLALQNLQIFTLLPSSSYSYITLMPVVLQTGQVPRLWLGVFRNPTPRCALDIDSSLFIFNGSKSQISNRQKVVS